MCYKILFLHRNIDSIIFKPFTMYLNFDNPAQLKNQIEVLQPTTGICIFIDICGSTAIKRNRLKEWFLLIGNTIRFCAGISPLFRINVIKLIGDEIMIFIPDDKMETSNENYASILGLLKVCISPNEFVVDGISMNTKAAVHYCTDTYNISYIDKNDDYYGNDIDLTARLMLKSDKNKIVLSEAYYQKVKSIDPAFLSNTTEKNDCQFKGIEGKSEYRILSME